MPKYKEIISQAIELSATIKEVFDYIEKKMSEDAFNQTFGLMQDVIVGLDSINQSFQTVINEVKNATDVENSVYDIKQRVSDVLKHIDHEEFGKALDVMHRQVASCFVCCSVTG